MVGDSDLRFVNDALPVDQLENEMKKEIAGWIPSGESYRLNDYDTCRLSGDNKRFSSSVQWAAWSMGEVRSPSGRWHEGGGDVFVADENLMLSDVGLIFPCRIQGAPTEQQEMIPLQVRVGKVGSPDFSDAFQQDLAIELAKSMRERLGCVNTPEIPDSLTGDGEAAS
jgi:hypothetical protein